jgi:hypothetical protein
MAFAAAGMNCVAVGPTKLWVYNTTDTLNSATVAAKTSGFCTDNVPGLSAGDIVFIGHNTAAALAVIRITAITATTCTFVEHAALA